MNQRVLVPAVLLALASVLVVWFVRSGDSPGREAEITTPATPANAVAAPAQDEELAPAPATPTIAADEEAEEPGTRSALLSEAGRREERRWEASATRWLDATVVLPPKTPGDERAWVLALEEDLDREHLHAPDGPLAHLAAGAEPTTVEGVLAATLVEGKGSARLALPPDASEAWLAVEGDFVYTPERVRVALGEGGVGGGSRELRPMLGARIDGSLGTPPGTAPAALADVEVKLRWSLNAALQLGTAGREDLDREARADEGGRFTFRAVPVGKPQTLEASCESLAKAISDDLTPEPGERLAVRLALGPGGTLRGRIVDEEGAPVAGADVRAAGRELFGNPTVRLARTESDTEGRFVLAHVTPGKVWVAIDHDDFQTKLTTPSMLADGEDKDVGDVVMSEGAALEGLVRFADGTPAEGARVEVDPDLSENVAGSPVNPRAFIGANNDDVSDATGAFRVRGLGEGPWVVAARLDVDKEDAGGRAPGQWSVTRELVRAPAEGLELVLEEPVFVSGRALDSAGDPVTAFDVHADRAGSQWYMPPSETREQSYESEDGRFVLSGLRAGSWTFSAVGEGFARSAELTLDLPTSEELTLELFRPVRITGRVLDPDGAPLAGAEVSKELEGTEVFEAMQGRGDWEVAKSGPEGAFALEGLAPGAGSVLAKRDGFAPSEAVSYELAEGQEQTGVELRLRRGGTIAGEVFAADGEPAAGCMVILQMPTLAERRFTNADARGTFREAGLSPGQWQVQAFPGIESLQSAEGEAMDQAKLLAALKMTTVSLADEAEEHVVLGEPPANPVDVSGSVTCGGEPVAGAVVSFVPAGGGGMEHLKIDTVDADGAYALRVDEPGDYLVSVQVAQAMGRQNTVEFRRAVPEAESHRLDLEMPLGRVSGRVEGPDGQPLAEARVTLNLDGGLVFGTVFGGQYNETVTGADGGFDIRFLRPGRYALAAGGAPLGGLFGEDKSFGREVVELEVQEDQWIRDVTFRLETPGRIVGKVRDAAGNLVSGASIFVRNEEGRLVELFSLAQTNASGSFTYPSLAPGEYTLTARSATLASDGTTAVRVRPGEETEATVVVDTGTVLVVTLIDQGGSDVPSRVSVLDAAGREMNGMLGLQEIMERYSGGLGSTEQRVGPLPRGEYQVRAFAADGRSIERTVTLRGKPERRVKLRLH